MTTPLAIDLFCGLGGWTEGLLAEGYYVVGFDIERHDYGTGGYPAQLVLQDALTLHGKQFKDAALIVASPPCQEFSYMAMPWSKAKAKERDLLEGRDDPKRLTALFDACFRIQREAIEAAGHFIPLVVENVRGAQKWVGRSRWNYGSFHLWGDVPALMPMTRGAVKVRGLAPGTFPPGGLAQGHIDRQYVCDCQNPEPESGPAMISNECPIHNWNPYPKPEEGHKVPGFRFDGSGRSFQTASVEGQKMGDLNRLRSGSGAKGIAQLGSKSPARKAASAAIAKIPFPLSQHIARAWKPMELCA